MIHKIKAMYDEGRGSSIKAISRSLSISRNTVRKYLRMTEAEIEAEMGAERDKVLDCYRGFLISLLRRHPQLKTPKVMRKLKAKAPDLEVSERSLRRYLTRLRPLVTEAQMRYYEPVIDDLPGVQCQVDGGELRDVVIAGKVSTVYFLVFVLSFSRLMYFSLSPRPINTETCIQMHDAAFRYFGGIPEECVYDQAKLVVINEAFRELTLNDRFRQYANQVGLSVHACRGYDPESKGKVEAGVKYVKGDCLYGDEYRDWAALQRHGQRWLDEVANQRVHGTTGKIPSALYRSKERPMMKPYIGVKPVAAACHRKADKTGLISFRANKYSVPMAYQRCTVGVDVIDDRLIISDLMNSTRIARHTLLPGKGQVVKNTDHYRDPGIRIADYETRLRELIGDEAGSRLCELLRITSPRIYRDQLGGALSVLGAMDTVDERLLARVLAQPRLTATGLRDYVQAFKRMPDGMTRQQPHQPARSGLLSQYAGLGASSREVTA